MRFLGPLGTTLLMSSTLFEAEVTAIRTFVNGTTGPAHDLHIVYTKDVSIARLSGTGAKGDPKIDPYSPNTVDITFKEDVPKGGTATVVATTDRADSAHPPQETFAIKQWWWTNKQRKPISRKCANGTWVDVFHAPDRGDEDPCEGPDLYTIWNKQHHWGGADRTKNKITIKMNITALLADAQKYHLDQDKLKLNIRAAIKQWTSCTDRAKAGTVPKSGPGNQNDGSGSDPAVMAPGESHTGRGKGKKFRSVAARECEAMLAKYPKGLEIEVVETGTKGDIKVHWGTDDQLNAKGLGKSNADPNDDSKTKDASIGMHAPDNSFQWHLADETDKDGFITNNLKDKLGPNEFDFYSVFKHEVGHVVCFSHAGENSFHDSEYDTAQPLNDVVPGKTQERSPFPTSNGDFLDGHAPVIFSSDRPGGYGGFDLWIATWSGDGWQVKNLGPAVNSAADETDPHLASDGTLLLFSSNRGDEQKHFHLFQSSFSLAEGQWHSATPLNVLNSPYEERHPSMAANMRAIFFASNRPGGLGGWDIWTAEWIPSAGYSEPYNLGAPVNSASDETDPAISGDGALLVFASNRSGGLGGSTYGVPRSVPASIRPSTSALRSTRHPMSANPVCAPTTIT
jgi:hypothetical protein